jgi:hypothetical protein
MNAGTNIHASRIDPELVEAEFSLAISPVPRIDWAADSLREAESAQVSQVQRRHGAIRFPESSDTGADLLTDALSVGWAVAIALAVALTVCMSGG